MTTMATNYGDQLGEIYPVMLNELNCTLLWPSWSWFVAVMVVAIMVCGRHGLWPSWFVAVVVCGRHGIGSK